MSARLRVVAECLATPHGALRRGRRLGERSGTRASSPCSARNRRTLARRGHRRDEAHAAFAARALEHVEPETAHRELGPRPLGSCRRSLSRCRGGGESVVGRGLEGSAVAFGSAGAEAAEVAGHAAEGSLEDLAHRVTSSTPWRLHGEASAGSGWAEAMWPRRAPFSSDVATPSSWRRRVA